MNIEFQQQKHICTNTGNRTIGFYSPNAAALETLLESTAAADEVKAQMRKWIEADAANNSPIDADDHEGYGVTFMQQMSSNNPFLIYCGQCLETLVFIVPECAV
jgi:hypothetical protein